MNFATKSGRIVDSLFPANVRDRLFSNAEHMDRHLKSSPEINEEYGDLNQDSKLSDNKRTLSRSVMKKKKFDKMRNFMGLGRRDSGGTLTASSSARNESNSISILNTPPIADLFDNTSIMFADIVGFTEWSSRNCPEDVFHLLETLFLEFDKIAKRMNVFKLGTIGDCYIAVTGIPDQSPDHGVVLCQFTEECRRKMLEVIEELEHVLAGVTKLNMRFGIHSGSVTAGVLRGTKSRFELFGDTINTASRMESLGIPGKIQLSQQTASLLIEAGHVDWIKPRLALVDAKGKGELQTYWLTMGEDTDDGDDADIELPLTTVTDNEKVSQSLFGAEEENIDGLSHCSSSSSIFMEKKD